MIHSQPDELVCQYLVEHGRASASERRLFIVQDFIEAQTRGAQGRAKACNDGNSEHKEQGNQDN